MYPSNPEELKKSPPPSAPPANYGYGLAQPAPPPATGIPVSSLSNANTGSVPALPAQFQTTTPGYWSTGLCDCFSDVSNCCITCWCPCITFGQIAEIVDRGSTSCAASGAIYTLLALFTGCACLYSCIYRSKMRQQYMLPESPCADCLLHCCCESFALCQEYRELKHRGFDMSLGWHGNIERQNRGVEMAPAFQQRMDR